ncbi:MAG: FKBP-type peptidyl-prolyl cis-trans isomerase [Labilibaculum antarcticum]
MKYSLLAIVFAFFVSCSSSDDEKDYRVENEAEIVAYVAEHGLNATRSNSGLYYVIEEEGAGAQVTSTSDVAVTYKGTYTNGIVLNDSEDNLVSFNLQGVIAGWTEGLSYFKEGGKGMLLVPAHLGYGNKDNNGVPGGSVLVFEITVFSDEMIADRNEAEIATYLEGKDLTATRTESGLYYIIEEEGTGEFPTETSTVTVSYKGSFLDGTLFAESKVSGSKIDLAEVIEGWKEGIPYFKVGGEGKLIIPAHLAYGSYSDVYYGIPSGSVFVYEVELISIDE